MIVIILMIIIDRERIKDSVYKNSVSSIEIGDLYFDIINRKVFLNCDELKLTKLEYDLLVYLSSSTERVFTYQQIYEAVWDEPYAYEKNNIMTHISHLRAKIEPDPTHPQYIENIRGVGYRFKKQ